MWLFLHSSFFPRLRLPLPRQRAQWMGAADIEFVIRSQLRQLQTKNPMNDDFYFQVMNARAGGAYRGVCLLFGGSSHDMHPHRCFCRVSVATLLLELSSCLN